MSDNEPNCDNCWKKGNYEVFMCPTKEKCIPARDYYPKGSDEERVRDATRQELISEFVNDLKNFSPFNKPPNTINDLIKKWEEKLKCLP